MPESTVYSRYEAEFAVWAIAQGWRVTKRGWPDFICRRGNELMAVEVKGGNDGLRSDQIDAILDLKRAGFPAFLWTPEWGLTEVPGSALTESVPALLSEIARLQGIVRDLTAEPQPLPPSEPAPALRARLPAEDAMAMAEITQMCNARHGKHARGKKMPQCAWLLYLSSRMNEDQIAAETGIEREKVIADLWHISDHLSAYLHRMRHNQLKRAGLRCAECITGAAA